MSKQTLNWAVLGKANAVEEEAKQARKQLEEVGVLTSSLQPAHNSWWQAQSRLSSVHAEMGLTEAEEEQSRLT